jgi:hypothetical protein
MNPVEKNVYHKSQDNGVQLHILKIPGTKNHLIFRFFGVILPTCLRIVALTERDQATQYTG